MPPSDPVTCAPNCSCTAPKRFCPAHPSPPSLSVDGATHAINVSDVCCHRCAAGAQLARGAGLRSPGRHPGAVQGSRPLYGPQRRCGLTARGTSSCQTRTQALFREPKPYVRFLGPRPQTPRTVAPFSFSRSCTRSLSSRWTTVRCMKNFCSSPTGPMLVETCTWLTTEQLKCVAISCTTHTGWKMGCCTQIVTHTLF